MSQKNIKEQQPLQQEDIQRYVDAYSDFSFEVKVLSALSTLGFSCSHSGTYTDPITQKTREYDIRASRNVSDSNFGHYTLYFSVECKNIRPESPIVLHCLKRRREEGYQDIIVSRDLNTDLYKRRITVPHTKSIYPKDDFTGKGIDQLKRKVVSGEEQIIGSDADVFEKVSQAISSAYDLIRDAGVLLPVGQVHVSSIIPTLVIPPGMLWKIYYDDSGRVIGGPEQVPHVSYYCGKSWEFPNSRVMEYRISHLEIVTIDYLEPFVESRHIDSFELYEVLKQSGFAR